MPTIPPPNQQWYVVHVLSGQEQKVAKRIRALTEREELKAILSGWKDFLEGSDP